MKSLLKQSITLAVVLGSTVSAFAATPVTPAPVAPVAAVQAPTQAAPTDQQGVVAPNGVTSTTPVPTASQHTQELAKQGTATPAAQPVVAEQGTKVATPATNVTTPAVNAQAPVVVPATANPAAVNPAVDTKAEAMPVAKEGEAVHAKSDTKVAPKVAKQVAAVEAKSENEADKVADKKEVAKVDKKDAVKADKKVAPKKEANTKVVKTVKKAAK